MLDLFSCCWLKQAWMTWWADYGWSFTSLSFYTYALMNVNQAHRFQRDWLTILCKWGVLSLPQHLLSGERRIKHVGCQWVIWGMLKTICVTFHCQWTFITMKWEHWERFTNAIAPEFCPNLRWKNWRTFFVPNLYHMLDSSTPWGQSGEPPGLDNKGL